MNISEESKRKIMIITSEPLSKHSLTIKSKSTNNKIPDKRDWNVYYIFLLHLSFFTPHLHLKTLFLVTDILLDNRVTIITMKIRWLPLRCLLLKSIFVKTCIYLIYIFNIYIYIYAEDEGPYYLSDKLLSSHVEILRTKLSNVVIKILNKRILNLWIWK